MRLTIALLRKKMPNGNIWSGKHRLYREVTPLMVADVRRKLEIEDQNMFYLRHPYLTAEQDHGHTAAMGKRENFKKRVLVQNTEKFPKHITIEERFNHLRVTEAWD